MNNNRTLDGVALVYSLYALGNSGDGSGGGGSTPSTSSQQWFVVNEPLSDGGSAPFGAKVGDLVLDNSGEIFNVVNSSDGYVLETTNVVLGGGTGEQKSLYELYVQVFNDTNTDPEQTALTEVEFNQNFIQLVSNSGQIGVTDRIISSDGKSSAIASETGLVINSTVDEVDGAVEVHNLKDPVSDLDAVNLRYLKAYVDQRLQEFYDLLMGVYVVYGGDCDDMYDSTLHGGDAEGMIDVVVNGGDADDVLEDTLDGGLSSTMDDEYQAAINGNDTSEEVLVLNGGASSGSYSGASEIPPIMTEGQETTTLSEVVSSTSNSNGNEDEDTEDVIINLNGGGAGT